MAQLEAKPNAKHIFRNYDTISFEDKKQLGEKRPIMALSFIFMSEKLRKKKQISTKVERFSVSTFDA